MSKDFCWKSNPFERHIPVGLNMWVPPGGNLHLQLLEGAIEKGKLMGGELGEKLVWESQIFEVRPYDFGESNPRVWVYGKKKKKKKRKKEIMSHSQAGKCHNYHRPFLSRVYAWKFYFHGLCNYDTPRVDWHRPYMILSWVRMSGPTFRLPPYNPGGGALEWEEGVSGSSMDSQKAP